MNLKTKFIAYFIAIGIIPILLIASFSLTTSYNSLFNNAKDKLNAVKTIKKIQIQEYFERKIASVENLSRSESLQTTLRNFIKDKGSLEAKMDKYFEEFNNQLTEHFNYDRAGYYDFFVIDTNGNILYTVAKEADYGTNLITGEYKDTSLGKSFKKALEEKKEVLSDFEWYAPSNEPAAFITTPMFDIDNNGKLLGVLAAQIPLDQINKVMQESTGLGKSGETYLVGNDLLLRSDSRLDKNMSVVNSFKEKKQIKTQAAINALKGESDTKVIKDYRGIKVLSSYSPLQLKEINWVILSEVDESEALADAKKLLIGILIVAILVTVAIVFTAIYISDLIVKPIKQIVSAIGSVAKGDLTINELKIKTKDEIGALGCSLNEMLGNLKGLIKNVVKSAEEVAAGSEELNAATEQTAQGAEQVSSSINQLATGAQEQAHNANDSLENINKINEIIQKIAKSSENTVKISQYTEKNASSGKNQSEEAVNKINQIKTIAQEVSGSINELGKLSSEIEQIVDLIKNIASQTNLLALNAAIEAARAGEHGKGFAVVAEEVKKLAGESAHSTDKINGMIRQIQEKTNSAVASMQNVVEEVDDGVVIVENTGNSLKEILLATKNTSKQISEISSEVNNLMLNTDEVVKMMENIASITEEASASAEEIASITEEQTSSFEEINANSYSLAKVAEELQKQASIFKI